MKASELKLWQVFYNNNGYKSIIYKIDFYYFYVMNYNGSFYTIKKEDSNCSKYQFISMSALEFISQFPEYKINHYYYKYKFITITKKILKEYKQNNKRLLLLL